MYYLVVRYSKVKAKDLKVKKKTIISCDHQTIFAILEYLNKIGA